MININDRHQWVLKEGDGSLRIGLNEYGLSIFGEIYGIDPFYTSALAAFPHYIQQTGIRVNRCDPLCIVNAEFWSGCIISPIAGLISGFNWPVAFKYPSPVNHNPYGSWIVKVSPYQSNEPRETDLPSVFRLPRGGFHVTSFLISNERQPSE